MSVSTPTTQELYAPPPIPQEESSCALPQSQALFATTTQQKSQDVRSSSGNFQLKSMFVAVGNQPNKRTSSLG